MLPTEIRRRPRDRKAQILQAAASEFSARGYHTVGVNDIAARLGISGPALYRHFPNKYALLAATAERAVRTLLDAAASAPTGIDPRRRLDAVLRALIETTIAERAGGGLYRWESRYLEPADRSRLRSCYQTLVAQLSAPLRRLRPGTDEDDARMNAAAAASVIGSITTHHTPPKQLDLPELLRQLCWTVLTADLPAPTDDKEPVPAAAIPVSASAADKRTQLIDVAVRIFGKHGYHETNVQDVAAAAGLTGSAVYRYFDSKAHLLTAALDRASSRMGAITRTALEQNTDSHQALLQVIEQYVALSFANPDLPIVYYAEFGSLPTSEQTRLRAVQRNHVHEWARLLTPECPDDVAARFRVHAALGLAIDLGRLTHFDTRAANRARVDRLIRAVLLDPPPTEFSRETI